jgi:hypothetical protein
MNSINQKLIKFNRVHWAEFALGPDTQCRRGGVLPGEPAVAQHRRMGDGGAAAHRRGDGGATATATSDGRRDGCGPGDVARTAAVEILAVGVAVCGVRQSASGSAEGEGAVEGGATRGAVGSGVRAVGTALSRQRFNPHCRRGAWRPCGSGVLPCGPIAVCDG